MQHCCRAKPLYSYLRCLQRRPNSPGCIKIVYEVQDYVIEEHALLVIIVNRYRLVADEQ